MPIPTKLLATVAITASLACLPLTPAQAEPAAPAQPVATTGTGSAAIDLSVGMLKLLICGMWATPAPNPCDSLSASL
ncbi:hypothetical protein VMT65_00990 [Nocardia sp. CDC153]|uniref:hypothetical protein n=1 Tax=Nocardia sp. CDC153 TaxID=3112167 RepID=UPI002DBE017C|nr:hypothetical protein [Nocardia sp. CDC153]MEC3951595.1 hypothetical protein [Nocardia sp. CDC153]